MSTTIWILAAAAYLLFRFWYDGPKRPLTAEEQERYMKLFHEQDVDAELVEIMRRFMEEDDGKEFLMANLVQFHESPLNHPDTGQQVSAFALLQDYYKPFMGKVIRRAGHPAVSGRGVGGYFDAWNTPPDPGWSICGLIRYRSRRDVLEVSYADPDFQAGHKYKVAAMKQTFAFPVKPMGGLYASPRVTVAMVLAIGALVAQLMLA